MRERSALILCWLLSFFAVASLAYAQFDDDCSSLRSEAELDLSLANRCEQDADCVSIPLRCPFGCEALVRKGKEESARSLTTRYVVRCGTCGQECPVLTGKIQCVNRVCKRISEKDSTPS